MMYLLVVLSLSTGGRSATTVSSANSTVVSLSSKLSGVVKSVFTDTSLWVWLVYPISEAVSVYLPGRILMIK